MDANEYLEYDYQEAAEKAMVKHYEEVREYTESFYNPDVKEEYESWLDDIEGQAIKCPSCDEVRVVDGVCGDCGYVEPERRI